jgi:metal transporter CNNM
MLYWTERNSKSAHFTAINSGYFPIYEHKYDVFFVLFHYNFSYSRNLFYFIKFFFFKTALEPFKRECISENILRRLLNQDIYHHIKSKTKGKNDPSMIIFQQGKPVDFFVLILEGRVEVTVGKENLIFEGGPFTHFGLQALIQNVGIDSPQQQQQQQQQATSQVLGSLQSLNVDAMLRHTFIPDYSVKALSDVVYVLIKRSLFMAAKRATLMEQSKRLGGDHSNDPLDDEVEKVIIIHKFLN